MVNPKCFINFLLLLIFFFHLTLVSFPPRLNSPIRSTLKSSWNIAIIGNIFLIFFICHLGSLEVLAINFLFPTYYLVSNYKIESGYQGFEMFELVYHLVADS